jgi:prolipoprotein diacylglyceryltransferase
MRPCEKIALGADTILGQCADAPSSLAGIFVPLITFPVYLHIGSWSIHPHWLFETLGYVLAFRVYLLLRRRNGDAVADVDRWWVIAAAAVGAALGSRILYWFEDPRLTLQHSLDPNYLVGGKTIVGALAGGLLFVELVKPRLGIRRPTGDLFAVPLCVGIAVGRVGCFLTGLPDHTYGIRTSMPWGINFGDGVPRHPTQLYEIAFALLLGIFLWRLMQRSYRSGDIFKGFMVGYFGFRLACDFLKPEVRVFAGLSSIQWVCLAVLIYYAQDILRWIRFFLSTKRAEEAMKEI